MEAIVEKPNTRAPWEKARDFIPGYMDEFGEFHPLPRSERWGDIMFEQDWPKMREKIQIENQRRREKIQIENQRRRGKAAAANAAQRAKEMERQRALQAFERENPQLYRNIQAQIAELRRLNGLARAAAADVQNPNEGDFKKDAQGKLFRWTAKPFWQIVKTGPANAPANIPSPKNGDIKKLGTKFYKWVTTPTWREVRRDTDYNLDLADTYARTNRLGKPYLNARDLLYAELYPELPPIRRPAAYQRRATRRNVVSRKTRRANGTRKS